MGNMSDVSATQTPHEAFWGRYAQAFAQPLQSNGSLAGFVAEQNVTGAYAEAWVRSMTRNMLGHRFRTSTGAVIRESDADGGLKHVPQCDLIVWDPSELPAIFEAGEFALVPIAAVRAIIEIKRACSTLETLVQQLETRRQCVPDIQHVLGIIIAHPEPLLAPVPKV